MGPSHGVDYGIAFEIDVIRLDVWTIWYLPKAFLSIYFKSIWFDCYQWLTVLPKWSRQLIYDIDTVEAFNLKACCVWLTRWLMVKN